MIKKNLKIFGIIIGIIFVLIIAYGIYIKYQIDRGSLVKWGGVWHTKEELKEKFPPQYIEVPAKNTPEEVYANFRRAILGNDIETALSLIREKNRESYRDAFGDKDKLKRWAETLPEEIEKEGENGNYAYYDVDYGTENKNTATFIKNSRGYWEIDQI